MLSLLCHSIVGFKGFKVRNAYSSLRQIDFLKIIQHYVAIVSRKKLSTDYDVAIPGCPC